MKLHNLPTIEGATHRHKRLGCGRGSGHGKTSGRGHKGMKARSGGGHRPGFEGGQMPIYRRLPHRGFRNINRVDFEVVNVADLEAITGAKLSSAELVAAGLIRSADSKLKVLGNGEIKRAVTITAHAFSGSAKAKIEKAGGKAVLIASAPAPEAK